MNYSVNICRLSDKFYAAYPHSEYPEIMTKDGRPYTCLMVEMREGYLICIPFRSHISHNQAFLFKNSNRSKSSRSGLDYKKAVIINNPDYITDANDVVVDNDEYKEMILNIDTIVSGVIAYIDNYIGHVNGSSILHKREYQRRYMYSTLPYFHSFLGLQ